MKDKQTEWKEWESASANAGFLGFVALAFGTTIISMVIWGSLGVGVCLSGWGILLLAISMKLHAEGKKRTQQDETPPPPSELK